VHTVAIHQPHYLPWTGYVEKWDQADLFLILDDAQFSRGGWQNRNAIKTAGGRQMLTVPVRHGGFRSLRDVEIDYSRPWQRTHIRTLQQAYAQAPHRHLLGTFLAEVYCRQWGSLGDLAVRCTLTLGRMLGIETPVVRSSTLAPVPGRRSDRLAALCRQLGADVYLAGDGCRVYLDDQPFHEAGIEVRWQGFTHPTWPQLHRKLGFVSHLSALDLLLNTGPEARTVLRGPHMFAGEWR
jgi:hypothetical protein